MLILPTIGSMNYFGERLTEALELAGLTQYRLSKLSGVPEGSVSKIVAGKKWPTNDIIKRFGEVEDFKSIGVDEDCMLEWRSIDDYPGNATSLKRAIAMREADLWRLFHVKYGTTEECLQRISEYIAGREGSPSEEIDRLVDELPLDKEPLREAIDSFIKTMPLDEAVKGREEEILKQLDRMDEEERNGK